uniref:Amidohydrolase-related domain-containing protein n=1 Tax=Terrapene triunguis TaxID=2587831 RepID=A0A674J5L0_9SAUR
MLANSATMRILIKGGKVVNDDCTLEADVYIENGIIQQVGRELMIPGGAKVIDATGKLVIPGGIDTSTHFHQTFMNATCVDDFYHGTKVPAARWASDAAGEWAWHMPSSLGRWREKPELGPRGLLLWG